MNETGHNCDHGQQRSGYVELFIGLGSLCVAILTLGYMVATDLMKNRKQQPPKDDDKKENAENDAAQAA